jgi:hypothetical protein
VVRIYLKIRKKILVQRNAVLEHYTRKPQQYATAAHAKENRILNVMTSYSKNIETSYLCRKESFTNVKGTCLCHAFSITFNLKHFSE